MTMRRLRLASFRFFFRASLFVFFTASSAFLPSPGFAAQGACNQAVRKGVCEMETAILQQMNALRTASGLRPLAPVSALSQVSRSWSCAMAQGGPFTHDGWAQRMEQAGFTPGAENIAMISGTPSAEMGARMFQMWKKSKGHLKNMLTQRNDIIGIGVCAGPEGLMGTQNFSVTRRVAK